MLSSITTIANISYNVVSISSSILVNIFHYVVICSTWTKINVFSDVDYVDPVHAAVDLPKSGLRHQQIRRSALSANTWLQVHSFPGTKDSRTCTIHYFQISLPNRNFVEYCAVWITVFYKLTVLQTIVAHCCKPWRTHTAQLWLIIACSAAERPSARWKHTSQYDSLLPRRSYSSSSAWRSRQHYWSMSLFSSATV